MGIDPIAGFGQDYQLDSDLIRVLHSQNLYVLHQACHHLADGSMHWKSVVDLGLVDPMTAKWNMYISRLMEFGIILSQDEDVLRWGFNSNDGSVTAKLAYFYQMDNVIDGGGHKLFEKIRYLQCGSKIRCFLWLALNNRIMTWSNLSRRGIHGPGRCVFCLSQNEDVDHLFVQCLCFGRLWDLLPSLLGFHFTWSRLPLVKFFRNWLVAHIFDPALLGVTVWELWKARNGIIFRDCHVTLPILATRIAGYFNTNCIASIPPRRRIVPHVEFDYCLPIGYFDGAAQNGICGAVGVLKVDLHVYYYFQFGAGRSSNMRSELLALWGLLFLATSLDLHRLCIFGDSQVIINWANGKCGLSSLVLCGWMNRVHSLISRFHELSFSHIYREFNSEVDKLSKLALGDMAGSILVQKFCDGTLARLFNLDIV